MKYLQECIGLDMVSLCSPSYFKRASNLLPLEWSSWFLRDQGLNHLCFARFDSNLNVTLPHLQIWISMVHLIVHLKFKLNNSSKEAKSVQAWFPHGGSGCASVLHGAHDTRCSAHCCVHHVKFWSKLGRWFVFRALRSWVLKGLLTYAVLSRLES